MRKYFTGVMCSNVKMRFFIYFLLCLCSVDGFNVDIRSSVVQSGPPGSSFGFTVAEHIENGQKWILVGAPDGDTRRRPDVERPGVVYRCDPSRQNSCQEIIFDHNGNNHDRSGRQIDQKSFEGFGSTLYSTGLNGPVVACAPRYISYVLGKQTDYWDPVGLCFLARDNFRNITEFSPCRSSKTVYNPIGAGQAGFSAAISADGTRLFMGAPGSFYWQGQLFAQTLDSELIIRSTDEEGYKHDDTYMGYSIVTLNFDNEKQGLAVGVPRAENLRGQVKIMNWDLTVAKEITGFQIGSYFGYSLASGDIDGDGLDDLIIGAPMYTNNFKDGSFETGSVYVYYRGSERHPFLRRDVRFGTQSRGRFGLALSSLKDINHDSYGDFAVGAPYGGPQGRGVVFIYHGSKDGVRADPSQIIYAEDIGNYVSTFGFSISGGVDLDGNEYPDIAVGAYESDVAVIFRSSPVVTMTASVQYKGKKLIALDKKDCMLSNRKEASCATFQYCLQYDGFNVDMRTEFELIFDLDTQTKSTKRLFFIDDGSSQKIKTIFLTRQKMYCNNATVYVAEEPRDKLTPLEVSLTYNLMNKQSGYLAPVLDMNEGNVQKDTINIQKNCGPDNVCKPDLRIQVTPSVERYLLGSNEKLGIDVFVQNKGEDAFEASYFLKMPPNVYYVRVERLETAKSAISVLCTTIKHNINSNSTLKCDIGNPLPANEMVNFKIVLQPQNSPIMNQAIDFDMEVNSTNPEPSEISLNDNKFRLSVGVFVDTNMSLSGSSNPPDLHYNASLYKTENIQSENDIGPAVTHIYELRNNGPSNIEKAEVYIMWPYQTLKGEDFFYVLVQPETSKTLRCEMAQHVNDRNLIVTNINKSFIEANEAQTEESYSSKSQTSSGWTSVSNSGSRASVNNLAHEEESYGTEVENTQQGRAQYGANTFTSGTVYTRPKSVPEPSMDWSKRPSTDEEIASRTAFQASSSSVGANGETVYYDSRGQRHFSKEANTLGHEGEAGSSFNNRYGGAQGSYYNNQGGYNRGYGSQNTHNSSVVWGDSSRNLFSTEETVNKDLMKMGSASFVGENSGEHEDIAAIAANKNGHFITNTLDLGTLASKDNSNYRSSQRGYEAGRGNYHSSQSGYQAGQGGYDGGGYQSGNVRFQGGQGAYRGSQAGYQGGYGGVTSNYESRESSFSAGTASRASSYSSGNQYSRSYSSQTGNQGAYASRPTQVRWKRQTSDEDDFRPLIQNCTANFKCALVRCSTIKTLEAGHTILIALRARVNAKVLKELTPEQTLIMSSLVGAKITQLPYIGRPDNPRLSIAEAKTVLVPQLTVPESKPIPLWAIILAAILGAFLLMLVIFLLFKCGFFKRNRPNYSAERAPLNRNGYGRDEHL